MNWIKSSLCNWDQPQCVEVRLADGTVEVRDSKHGDDSPILRFTPHEWDTFTAACRSGEFDTSRLMARTAA